MLQFNQIVLYALCFIECFIISLPMHTYTLQKQEDDDDVLLRSEIFTDNLLIERTMWQFRNVFALSLLFCLDFAHFVSHHLF